MATGERSGGPAPGRRSVGPHAPATARSCWSCCFRFWPPLWPPEEERHSSDGEQRSDTGTSGTWCGEWASGHTSSPQRAAEVHANPVVINQMRRSCWASYSRRHRSPDQRARRAVGGTAVPCTSSSPDRTLVLSRFRLPPRWSGTEIGGCRPVAGPLGASGPMGATHSGGRRKATPDSAPGSRNPGRRNQSEREGEPPVRRVPQLRNS